jgi:TPR repeat protein
MKKLFQATLFALMLMPSIGMAQDFNSGLQAAHAGDFATALKEWKPLAEQGDATAQFNLGMMYYYGDGVPQDYSAAARWYRLSAEQGDVDAQQELGYMYQRGFGVLQVDLLAYMWYNIASANGYVLSGKFRDKIAAKMTSADIAEAQRRARVCMESHYQDCD